MRAHEVATRNRQIRSLTYSENNAIQKQHSEQFLAQCRTQISSGSATAVPTPASSRPQPDSLFPWEQPTSPAPAPVAPTATGNQSVMKQCGAQWQAAKAAGTISGATWPQFLKACRTQLATTTNASPQGGFAP